MTAHREAIDESGFYPSAQEVSNVGAWVEFLNQAELPTWARGERVARVFFEAGEAETEGFVLEGNSWGVARNRISTPVVVIEQGHVQIWCHLDRTKKPRELLTPETYRLLQEVDLFPTALAEREQKLSEPLTRIAVSLFGSKQALPRFLDVSADGQTPLTYIPALHGVSLD